jgi:hypothetical protein
MMQRFQQYALRAARIARGPIIESALAHGDLHAFLHPGHAVGEARGPRGCAAFVLFFHLRVPAFLFRGRRGGTGGLTRSRHFRQHPRLHQTLVQRLVKTADAGHQVAFAQLDDHQPHFQGKLAGGEGLVDGHADVFGTDRIVVVVQHKAAGDPAQAAIQALQHRLAIAHDHTGQVACGQARFQFLVRHQAQHRTGVDQCAFHRYRFTRLKRMPGFFQVGAEAGDDFFATTTQLAHRVQEGHLRIAGAFGTVEQRIVEAAKRHGEGIHQRRDDGLPGLGQQPQVATRTFGDVIEAGHAQGSPPWQAKKRISQN